MLPMSNPSYIIQGKAKKTEAMSNPKCCWWRKAKSPLYKHAIAAAPPWRELEFLHELPVALPFNKIAPNCLHCIVHYIKILHYYLGNYHGRTWTLNITGAQFFYQIILNIIKSYNKKICSNQNYKENAIFHLLKMSLNYIIFIAGKTCSTLAVVTNKIRANFTSLYSLRS